VSYAPVHSVRHIGLAVAATAVRAQPWSWVRTADSQSKHGASWKLRHISNCIRYKMC